MQKTSYEAQKRYNNSPEGRAVIREAQKRYDKTPKGIARRQKYESKKERTERKNTIFLPLWRTRKSLEFVEQVLKDRSWDKPSLKFKVLSLISYHGLDRSDVKNSLIKIIKFYKGKIKTLESMK